MSSRTTLLASLARVIALLIGASRYDAARPQETQDAAAKQYIQSAVGGSTSTADELARLADLKDRGVIDDAEFQRLKAKALA